MGRRQHAVHSFLAVVLSGFMIVAAGACSPTPKSNSTASRTPSPSASANASAGTQQLRISGTTFPLTITDFVNNTVTFDHAPTRVAVLSGTLVNIWYDAGGKAICGPVVTDNLRVVDGHEQEIKALPQVGKSYAVNMEALASYNPDLIITMAGEQDSQLKRLRELGFKTLSAKVRSLGELDATYTAFGVLTGHPELAKQRTDQIKQQQASVLAKLPATQTSVAIVYVTSKSLAVKLDNSIAGQMANILKLHNIVSDLTPDNPGSETTPLDIEEIARQQPDYILVTSMVTNNAAAKKRMQEQFASNSAWQAINAVRDGKVIYLPQQYFLFNAGPYYGDALEWLAASIYPSVYGPAPEVP